MADPTPVERAARIGTRPGSAGRRMREHIPLALIAKEILEAETAARAKAFEEADVALGLDETLARSPFFQRHARDVIRARAKEAR